MDALYILYLSDTVRSLVRTSGRRSLRDHCPHAHPVPSLVPSASDVVRPSAPTAGARYVSRGHRAPAEQHARNVSNFQPTKYRTLRDIHTYLICDQNTQSRVYQEAH